MVDEPRAHWPMPLGNYCDFDGWQFASEGDAIWHLSETPFTHGTLHLT
ncbi:hypothetical protein [Parasphingorhabdus sp.]